MFSFSPFLRARFLINYFIIFFLEIMPFSQQMKSAFSETERIIHVALKQLSEKRSEREITNFKVCINKQLAVLRQKCSAMESHFVKKVSSCTNLTESFLVSLMQEGDPPMMSTSKRASLKFSRSG